MLKGIFNFIRRYKILIIIIVILLLLYILPFVALTLVGIIIIPIWIIVYRNTKKRLPNPCSICYINVSIYLLSAIPEIVSEIKGIVIDARKNVHNMEHSYKNNLISGEYIDDSNYSDYIHYKPLYIINDIITKYNNKKEIKDEGIEFLIAMEYLSFHDKLYSDGWKFLYNKQPPYSGGVSIAFIDGLRVRYNLKSFEFGKVNIESYTGGKKYYILDTINDRFPSFYDETAYKAIGLLISSGEGHVICALKIKGKVWKIYDEVKKAFIKTNLSNKNIQKEIIDKKYTIITVLYKKN